MILLLVALVPLVVLLVWWTTASPFRALILYAFILPLGSSLTLPLGLPDPFNTFSTLLGAVAGVLLLLRLVVDPDSRSAVPAVTWVWVMFLGLNALTYLWSINREETLAQLFILAPLVGLFAVASMYRTSTEEMNAFEGALVAGGALAGLVAVGLAVTGNLYPSGTGVDRFYASGGDPNITAASLLMPFAVAVSWAVEGDLRNRRLGFVAAVLISFGVLLTVSRGGVLSLLLIVAFWLVFTRRPRLLWAAGLVAVLAVMFLPDGVTERLTTETDSTGRTAIWEVGAAACTEHCLIGAGMGVFPEVHQRTIVEDPTKGGTRQMRFESHNILLGAAVELGVVGLALLIIGLTMTLMDTRHAAGRRRRAAISGLAGVLLANMLVSNLEFKYFWLALTYATLVSELGRRAESPLHSPTISRMFRWESVT